MLFLLFIYFLRNIRYVSLDRNTILYEHKISL